MKSIILCLFMLTSFLCAEESAPYIVLQKTSDKEAVEVERGGRIYEGEVPTNSYSKMRVVIQLLTPGANDQRPAEGDQVTITAYHKIGNVDSGYFTKEIKINHKAILNTLYEEIDIVGPTARVAIFWGGAAKTLIKGNVSVYLVK